MDKKRYTPGTRVVSLDDQDIGTVQRVDHVQSELEVRLKDDGGILRVPYEVIDDSASSRKRIVIQGAVGDLKAERSHVEMENAQVTEPGDAQTLSLVGEEATAHVRDVSRGRVIIDKHVELVPHEANVEIGTDVVEVNRVPVNEEFEVAPGSRQEGDTLIVPVVEEVLVVSKRYRVIEEVHVTKRREMHTEIFEEDLQREVVDVREVDADENPVER